MSKPVIAIDIDDVLAANAEGFVAFSNERWGTNLRPEDYHEHWAELWQVDHEETQRRAVELHASGIIGKYRHYDEAKAVLAKLKKSYRLIVATSRRTSVEPETRAWLDMHFEGMFDEIHFAGIFDKKVFSKETWAHTKAEIFSAIGARYVIDDQLKHCVAAAELGIETVLFGDYPWNQTDKLPDNITRCHDWVAVEKYFDGKPQH